MTATVLVCVTLAACGTTPPRDPSSLASSARASLLSTFTSTSFRLTPLHGNEAEQARCFHDSLIAKLGTATPPSPWTAKVATAESEANLYCSLTSSETAYLFQRLDEGLGSQVTSAQKTCIDGGSTKSEMADLLAARLMGPTGPAEISFDRDLGATITRCTGR